MKLQLLIALTSGLFAAGTIAVASRSRAWLGMNLVDFKTEFARAIAIADRAQPALAHVTLAAIVAAALESSRPGETYAIGAGVTLITIQRRIIDGTELDDLTASLRLRWIKDHLGRTAAALVAFGLTIAALIS